MEGNTLGRVFRVTAAGESYGPALQIIVDGVPPGLPLTEADVQYDLDRRRPGQSAINLTAAGERSGADRGRRL